MPRTMSAIILILWCESAISGDAVPPTPFEALALSPDVVVQDSRVVGEIKSDDSVVTLTLIVLDDGKGLHKPGLRIDLQSNSATDVIYLDAAEITRATNDLAELESGASDLLDSNPDHHGGALWLAQGTARCWMPASPQRILCPAYNAGPEGASLVLEVFGGPYFSFPGRSPRELIELVDKANVGAAN